MAVVVAVWFGVEGMTPFQTRGFDKDRIHYGTWSNVKDSFQFATTKCRIPAWVVRVVVGSR